MADRRRLPETPTAGPGRAAPAADENAQHAGALVEALVACGVGDVVISPGSRNTPLVLAFDGADARTHVALDERAAGFYALGLSRASNRPTALVCTSGSAGAHYLPAVIEATASGVPLVVLTADRPPELQHVGAPQTIDQTRLFGSHVRWFADLGAPHERVTPRWLGVIAARAIDYATSGTGGAVHLNVPFREPLWDDDAGARRSALGARHSAPRVVRGAARIPSHEVEALASRLAGPAEGTSSEGVIICGLVRPGCSPGFAEAVISLAEALGWPVLAEPTSGVRFSADVSDQVVTTYDALLRDDAVGQALAPDLVLRFGQAPTSKAVNQWLARCTPETILVDHAGAWHDPTVTADTLIGAEPAWLCRALRRALGSAERRAPSAERRARSAWFTAERAARAVLDAAHTPGWEGHIARALAEAMPDDSALFVGSSMPIRDLDAFAPRIARDIAVHSNRGANGIDGLVSTPIGLAAGRGDRATVGLLGDLSFLHDVDGLAGAVDLGATCTLVVVNNGGGGIFGFLPISRHDTAFERYFATPQRGDIALLCQAVGIRHTRVTAPQTFSAAFVAELARPGIGVVEVIIEREHNLERHREVFASVASVARAALGVAL